MAAQLEARPFDGSQVAAIADFVARRTRGAMKPSWVTQVLGTAVGDAAAVHDLWRGGARVAVGVSIDGLETEGDAAELSLFCEPPDHQALTALLTWGEARARTVGRRRSTSPAGPAPSYRSSALRSADTASVT